MRACLAVELAWSGLRAPTAWATRVKAPEVTDIHGDSDNHGQCSGDANGGHGIDAQMAHHIDVGQADDIFQLGA